MRDGEKVSGTGNNSTRVAPYIKGTHLYRCHLHAQIPLSLSQVDCTNVYRAANPRHALGHFIADFRNAYPDYTVLMKTITVERVFPAPL